MKKRFALLLGAPQAGTTRLFRLLGSHPQVLACRVKEPRFFSDDRKWALGLDWYRSLWDFREPDERIAIEASGDYACHPRVPSPALRIAGTPAGFRFVYVLRDPVQRIAAQHASAVAEGLAEPAADPRQLLPLLDGARYATQLARYREHFPAEDFLLLAHQELARAPRAALRRVCRFLEIDPFFAFPDLDADGRRARPPRGRLGRLAGRLRRDPRNAGPPKPAEPPPGLRDWLRAELAGELETLERDWGFDTSDWCSRG